MSRSYAPMKCALLIIVLCCSYFHVSQTAFPLERDVKELVGISQPKRWIVFMERKASRCLNDVKTKMPTSLMYALRCIIDKGIFYTCLVIFVRGQCVLIHRYPNALKFVNDDAFFSQKSIQIVIHQQFNVNVTMLRCNMPTVRWTGLGYNEMYFEIAEKKFRGPHHAVTVIALNNSIKIKFNTGQSYNALIEYDVVQNYNKTNHLQMRENALYFPWGDFLVTCFQIKIDVKARLSLGIITCVTCDILVYDGPNERLPIIMNIRNTRQAQRVVGSTFQVYVVIIEADYEQKSHMAYTPIFSKTAAFNLSTNGHHELSFDNHTHCYGQSFAARLCVYKYYTATSEKILFTLIDLNFKGRYKGSDFAAGIFLFNQFGETVVNLMKFNRNLPSLENKDFEIIGTEMHVAIFVYSDFASLSLKFSMSKTNCNILLVCHNYVFYSGYITPADDIPHVFYVKKPSKDLPEYGNCFQFQFVGLAYEIIIIFPKNTQLLMTITGFKFKFHNNDNQYYHPCRTDIIAMAGKYHVKNGGGKYHGGQTIVSSIKYLKVLECFPNTYMQIRIKWLPCKMPCRYLDLERYCDYDHASGMMWPDNDNVTCDICETRYTSCDLVLLKHNISFSIDLNPKLCFSVELSISNRIFNRSPSMTLALNKNNMISRIPGFTGWIYTWISSDKCVMEIPKAALYTGNTPLDKAVTLNDVKAAYWGGVLYYRLSLLSPVSWEKAAQHCQGIGAFLLTIHSLAEYHFIKDTFLQSHDTSVLYIGLKRQVIKVIS